MVETAGRTLTMRSPAKINWTLKVIRRREDGYHELESLVSPVSLYDELTFSQRDEPGIRIECDRPGIPLDESNLVAKAVRLLAERAGRRGGLECDLHKRVPPGGGLGGGSSNAATTLMALNLLWNLAWPKESLAEMAAQLGSDVPLFLHGGPVIMRGRGEQIESARPGWDGWVVLVFPGLTVSTAAVYREWRPGESEDGDALRLSRRPADAAEWMSWTFNMLEPPAMRVCPALSGLMRQLEPLAGRAVRMSGSGSTLFTAFDAKADAERFAGVVRDRADREACVVRPIGWPEDATFKS